MVGEAILAPAGCPVGTNFLVLPDPKDTSTEAGVILTDRGQEAKNAGTVVAVGPDVPSWCVPGRRVIWCYAPTSKVTLEGENYYLMDQDSVALYLPGIVDVG